MSNGLLIPKFGLSRIDTIPKPRPDSRIYAQNPRPPRDKGGHFLRFLWHNFGTKVGFVGVYIYSQEVAISAIFRLLAIVDIKPRSSGMGTEQKGIICGKRRKK